MALNYIWIAFFVIAFIIGICKVLFTGDIGIFTQMMNATFDSSKNGFEFSLALTGVLSLWMGFMKIGERGGVVNTLARWSSPVFSRLFPEIPKGHPAMGSIFMNFAANMLNLDNAATPVGLKAMQELQNLNKDKNSASNPMIMFLVLNASGLTLIPIMVMSYRAQAGAKNPADVFIPLMIATTIATLAGVLFVCFKQKIKLDKVLLGFFGFLLLFIALVVCCTQAVSKDKLSDYTSLIANCILFIVIISFILAGVRKKVNVYDAFIEGAKDGFKTAVMIIPYLIAILVGIALFRTSGAMEFLTDGLSYCVSACGLPTAWTEAFPTALMKPLSGSGARGMMIDTMQTFGADSFTGRMACVFQGSTDTTFYLVAVYYGAVNVKNTRYTIPGALLADLAGLITAIFVCYLFF
ncbi:MAG: spore maturation protein [Candidatus Symbiothrix sp.]|jgi:spore maturation protein SpmA|nr:spore maturation protein [Candidatus Symbiothrix sp.]